MRPHAGNRPAKEEIIWVKSIEEKGDKEAAKAGEMLCTVEKMPNPGKNLHHEKMLQTGKFSAPGEGQSRH
jgi:hypothetical protein